MTTFTTRVYETVRQIPPGKVATYGDVAVRAGSPRAARAVGAAMSHNPDVATIPCHRVVGSDGRLHGYAFGGVERKRALLAQEGVVITGNRVDLTRCRWKAA